MEATTTIDTTTIDSHTQAMHNFERLAWDTLNRKRTLYARGDQPRDIQFTMAATLVGLPKWYLPLLYVSKHITALYNLAAAHLANYSQPTAAELEELLVDIHNYVLLLWSILTEEGGIK
jgi:hypothetical protein